MNKAVITITQNGDDVSIHAEVEPPTQVGQKKFNVPHILSVAACGFIEHLLSPGRFGSARLITPASLDPRARGPCCSSHSPNYPPSNSTFCPGPDHAEPVQ